MASNPPFLVEDTDEDFFDKLVNDDDDDYKVTPSLGEGADLGDGNDSDDVRAFADLSVSDVGAVEGSAKVDAWEEEDAKASSLIKGKNSVEDSVKVDAGEEEDVKASSLIKGKNSVEPSHSLVSSNSFAFDSVNVEDTYGGIVLEETVDDTTSTMNHGLGGAPNSFAFDGANEENNNGGTGFEEPTETTSSGNHGHGGSMDSFAFGGVNEKPNNEGIGLKQLVDSTTNGDHGSGGAPSVKEVQWSAFATDPVEMSSNTFGSYSDFFTEFGVNPVDPVAKEGSGEPNIVSGGVVDGSSHQFQEIQAYATAEEQSTEGQDPNSSQSWENLYPGWRYDPNTEQWYQVNKGYDMAENTASEWTVSNEKSEVSYLQQTAQSFTEAVAEKGTTESVTSWNPVSQASHTNESSLNWDQTSQETNGYPSHMVFDPQYPGWYYDMYAQEWCSLDAYNSQSTVQAHDQNGFSATNNTYYGHDEKAYGGSDQLDSQSGSEVLGSQGQDYKWNGSFSNVEQRESTMWQPDYVAKSEPMSNFGGNEQVENHHGSDFRLENHVSYQQSYDFGGTASPFDKTGQVHNGFPAVSGSQTFVPSGNFSQSTVEQSKTNFSNVYGNQNQLRYSQQPAHSGQQVAYASTAGRSSAGRPPHALVTFGFGGKLIVMKDNPSIINPSYGGQDSNSGSISVHNLAEVFTGGTEAASSGEESCSYFHALCRQSFPGPLSGGNVGGKELNKWFDERITHSESPEMDYRERDVLKLLLSLLKIASQHYGKLRSPFGTDTTKENDAPEVAVARLFASVKKNGAEYIDYGSFTHCLQQLPSEGQTQATAAEVQTLLVSGRKKEALHCAQEGQLWGPALVLAAQLGDQFYVDTVKKMALRQLVAGSPLRTLCLLIAGQPADVFSTDTATNGAMNMSQHPVQAQPGENSMLEDWEENLAVITANRTKDDELVLIHLGDCLWKEKSNIIAAHICYLVAEPNFEPYSDCARLCLIGADHWKHPRTYATPEAIQRTEVYEYSKLLGNSQFTLVPFQPYKLVYAHMLAEVGRVSDSLKYCQAVSKALKTCRGPELETLRHLVSALEDRLKTHQQGGFSTNLAPGKLVGKLLNLFDSTAHRVVGGLPPPVPPSFGGSTQNDHHQQPTGSRVSASQSTMAMSSLVPSASMDPMSQWSADGNNRMMMHNRSASEPDFGRSSKQVDQSKENSADSQNKSSGSTSRFAGFGFGSQLLQKTVGLVLKPRQEKQAKLGETNKFYYDEKLKRWVEEGAAPPAEEAALAPPPTMAAFQNGTSDYSLKTALKNEGPPSNGSPESAGPSSGIPPIPTGSNQFSARGRTGVRARYVDTFNQGGAKPTNLFQSPPAATVKPPTTFAPKIFIPTAEQPDKTSPDNLRPPAAAADGTGNHPFPSANHSFRSPSPPPSMQRFASMDDLSDGGIATFPASHVAAATPESRRAASWSGGINEEGFRSGAKPLGEVLGLPLAANGGGFGDDLHEVDL